MVRVAISAVNQGRKDARTRDKDAIANGAGGTPGVQSWQNNRPSISDYFGVYDKQDEEDIERGFWECWWICKYQRGIKKWYRSDLIQVSVAVLIFINFIISAAGAESYNHIGTADPALHGRDHGIKIFFAFELFFTIIFTFELGANMFGHWWWLFWADGWNWFDFIVVAVSLLSLLLPNLPGVAVLRLLRAFRVFRLFKRMESLRKIIKSLEESIPGVANAFMILMLVMSIYAILGVEFFRHTFVHPWNAIIQPNYFENFFDSLFTLFQTMTGESWSEAIARPCIRKHPVVGAIYFVSFVLINGFVLVNVAIAVLLEKMMGDEGPGAPQKHVWLVLQNGRQKMKDEREGAESQQQTKYSDDQIKEINRTVYTYVDKNNLVQALESLKDGRFLCAPPPPDDGDEDEELLADDGTVIEQEVDEDDETRRSVLVETTEVQDDPMDANRKLIKVVFDQVPYVQERCSIDKHPSGYTQRPARSRDGFSQYEVPPEKLHDMMRRVETALFGYINLMDASLDEVNRRIDRIGTADFVKGGQPPPLSGTNDGDSPEGDYLSMVRL